MVKGLDLIQLSVCSTHVYIMLLKNCKWVINYLFDLILDYQPSLLPDWAHPELSQLPYGILPVYRTVKNFNQLKKEDADYHSAPFYTSQGGYKLTLNVYTLMETV